MIETKALAPSTRAGGRWSNFSISGKLMSTCGRRCGVRAGEHLRQAVQRLRAEHDVDIGRALDDRRAFLAGDAAADADQHALLLEVLDAAEVAEDLLLRLLAHRAGVEEDQVGLLDVVGRLVALGGAQHVGHLVRVVLVHLAAEGADEDLLARASLMAVLQVCAAASKGQASRLRGRRRPGLAGAASAGVSIQTSCSWPVGSQRVVHHQALAGERARQRRAGCLWPRMRAPGARRAGWPLSCDLGRLQHDQFAAQRGGGKLRCDWAAAGSVHGEQRGGQRRHSGSWCGSRGCGNERRPEARLGPGRG